MSIRVLKYRNPSMERSTTEVEVHHVAREIRITPSGTLEVIEIKDGVSTVVKAYGAGHWIEAWQAIENYN